MAARCINLDWLEVFALEPAEPHDANYFRRVGFFVHERDYGTRIYNEMFTLEGTDGHPLLEVRRSPKNPLMAYNACHIRFVNRTCYFDNAADIMADFLERYGYTFCNISRVDVCLDLVRFDDNTLPRVFMARYMRGKFSKVNQANIHAHGSDRWTGRVWNSVAWGSPTSNVGTKFYNKTLELYDPRTDSYAKPHIRHAWLLAGLIDNVDRCTLDGVPQEIWRVEFSLRSSVKRWLPIEVDGRPKAYHSIPNTLDRYNTREKLLVLFASLCRHYFHFKRYMMEQRKDRCPDRVLFRWDTSQPLYKVGAGHVLSEQQPPRVLTQLIHKLRQFILLPNPNDTQRSAQRLLEQLEALQLKYEQANPYSDEEARTLQILLSRRLLGDFDTQYNALLQEVAQALRMHPRVLF